MTSTKTSLFFSIWIVICLLLSRADAQPKLSVQVKALVAKSCRVYANGQSAKKSLKAAYKKYVILDPAIMKKDFAKSRQIHQAFRRAHGAVRSSPARFLQACKVIQKLMAGIKY